MVVCIPQGGQKGGGKAAIIDFTPQAKVVYNILESGVSLGNAVVLLNAWRRHPNRALEGISYDALRRFVNNSPVIVRRKRKKIKDGSKEPGSFRGVVQLVCFLKQPR